jgi:hypothetical protein
MSWRGMMEREENELDGLRSLLDVTEDLVELGREEVQSSHDTSVRSKVVPVRRQ